MALEQSASQIGMMKEAWTGRQGMWQYWAWILSQGKWESFPTFWPEFSPRKTPGMAEGTEAGIREAHGLKLPWEAQNGIQISDDGYFSRPDRRQGKEVDRFRGCLANEVGKSWCWVWRKEIEDVKVLWFVHPDPSGAVRRQHLEGLT